jgi:transcriptional regulator with XRE-family HTH domain
VNDEQIGVNLRRVREAAGMSQAELASLAAVNGWEGVYPQTILKIEKGTRSLKVSEVPAIAASLGIGTKTLAAQLTEGAGIEDVRLLGEIRGNYGAAMGHRNQAVNHLAEMMRYKATVAALLPMALEAGLDDETYVVNARWLGDMSADDFWGDIRLAVESFRADSERKASDLHA